LLDTIGLPWIPVTTQTVHDCAVLCLNQGFSQSVDAGELDVGSVTCNVSAWAGSGVGWCL
jgi:hypothetical protein